MRTRTDADRDRTKGRGKERVSSTLPMKRLPLPRTSPVSTWERRGLAVAVVLLALSCKTKDVHDAEARVDIAFLETNDSAESTAALGRLADQNPRALAVLETRAKRGDVNAYIAAWQAQLRGSSWSGAFFHEGLSDPARAVVAQSALPRKDPKTAELLPDLEAAFSKLPGPSAARVGALIASLGAPAKPAVTRALDAARTRGSMCDALSSPDASPEALEVFRTVAPEKRDDSACTNLAATRAETDDTMATWLGKDAEPGLLVNASKRGSLSCPRAALVWEKALLSRPREAQTPLSAELVATTNRCAATMDPVMERALQGTDESRAWVVAAIDPQDRNLDRLVRTCVAMKAVALGGAGTSVRTRERARDTVARGCSKALAPAK